MTEPHDVEIVLGQSAKVTCAASGSPIPKVTWHKQGKYMRKCIYLNV